MSLKRIVRSSCIQSRTRVAVVLITIAMGAACGGPPAAPSDPYAGVWTGTIQDDRAGTGRLTITLSDTINLAGSWAAELTGIALSGSASLAPGFAVDPARRFVMTCGAVPSGGSILFMPSLEGSTLEGRYLGLGCGNLTQGTARLTRR